MNSYLSSTIDSPAHGSTSSSLSFSNTNIGRTKKSTLSAATSSILNRFTQSSNSIRTDRSDSVYSTDATDVLSSRTSGPRASLSASMIRSPTIASEDSTRSSYSLTSHDIVTGLLRASHAESKGATSDLLLILGRTGKEEGVEFGQVEQQVTIYYGTKDDRISLSSIEMVQKQMKNCQIKLIEGGDHNLMTNSQVMIEVLESIVAHVS
jgi:pimeloyl-ACP methyl ester carboxylesterase